MSYRSLLIAPCPIPSFISKVLKLPDWLYSEVSTGYKSEVKKSKERIILQPTSCSSHSDVPLTLSLIFKAFIFWYAIKYLYLLCLLFIIYLFLWNVNFKRARIFVYDIFHQPVRGLTYSSRCSKIICWIELKLKLGQGLKFPSLISEPSDF